MTGRALLVLAFALVPSSVLHAQTMAANDPLGVNRQAAHAAALQFAVERVKDITLDLADTQSGSTFVERATAVSGWSLGINSNATLDGYGFPVTLKGTPLRRWLRNSDKLATGIRRRLALTELTGAYTPLSIKRAASPSRGVSTSSAQTASFAIKVPLLGVKDIEDFEEELSNALGRLSAPLLEKYALPDNPNLVDIAAYGAAVRTEMPSLVAPAQRTIERQLKLSARLKYDPDWRADKPDAVSFTLTGGRDDLSSGPAKPKHRVGLTANLGRTWFRDTTYRKSTLSLTLDVVLMDGLRLSIQPAGDRYAGAGFPGISGVEDKSERTDVVLAEILTFTSIPAADKLEFTVKQLHLNTSSTDVSLSLALGFVLAPR